MDMRALRAVRATLRIVVVSANCALCVNAPASCATAKPIPAAAVLNHCTVASVVYFGWKAEELRNRWVKLIVVPQLGGRLMQVTFNGHDFLFVNDQLKGQVNPPDTEHFTWYNYGGDKIWPMPEGSRDEQHWPGAGGAILDEAPFTLRVLSRGNECAVRLTGPGDPQIGEQYIRDIRIGSDTPVISFHAVMKNVSGYPQTWSEQSVSQYNAAAPSDPTEFNSELWGVTSANPSSVFPSGYHVRTGSEDNPGCEVKDGLFKLHWNNTEREIWVDSPGAWLAVVDGTTKYTMVERNRYDARADYPGQSTMIFYTTGEHQHHKGNGTTLGEAPPTSQSANGATPKQNSVTKAPIPIAYMEAEVNSPIVELAPGESYAMDTTWYPTRMGEDFKTTTYSGAVGTPLAAAATDIGLTLSGNFGVFYAGSLIARYYDRSGQILSTAKLMDVTPIDQVNLQTTVQAPAETFRVSVHVVEKTGVDRGPLGEAFVNPPPMLNKQYREN